MAVDPLPYRLPAHHPRPPSDIAIRGGPGRILAAMILDPTALLTYAVAFAVGVIATGRFTRLIVHDDWPPVAWARAHYRRAVRYGEWEALVTCPFCFAAWPALVNLGWAWWSGLHWSWWAANVWFAAAYLAAILVVRDEPPEG